MKIETKKTVGYTFSLALAFVLSVAPGVAHAAGTCENDPTQFCNDASCASDGYTDGTGTCSNPGGFVYCCGPAISPGTGPGEDYVAVCSELENDTWEGAPSPLAIICPLIRYLNIILFASAAVFVMMVFATAIKYSLAQGDPKALQGAKGTLTWAIVGFIVIIGVFTMLIIFKNVLGLKDNPILNPVGVLNDNLMELLDKFGITNYK